MNLNLSEWSLRNRGLVLYFMIALGVIGALSFRSLGQSEDPPFTFKIMVVQTFWPGATAAAVADQVTDRIEEKLQEMADLEYVRSYSRPGESLVFVELAERVPRRDVPAVFYEIRKKIGDIRHTLPDEAVGPFFNDEFGDTFGNILALTGDGFGEGEKKQWAQRLRGELLRLDNVAKVDLVGVQDETVYIELDNSKLATLGVSYAQVRAILEQQNTIAPAGWFETESDRIHVRTSGAFDSVEAIADLAIRANGQLFRLGDVASVRRGLVDPEAPRMRYLGSDALGLALSMVEGGDILALGRELESALPRLQAMLPLGLDLHRVADQPAAVRASVGEFLKVLAEAVIIVLLVCFFSLGARTGLVVAISIPLVLAMTFAGMALFGIDLHKISLGALVLALGLLVDDAIIAVEMMSIKMEQGMERLKAAAFAYRTTAFPMLAGTLVTAAGFLPIATAASNTGEYTRSLFQVVTLALLLSWIVAVLFVPYLGDKLLPDLAARARAKGHPPDPYQRPFYRRFRRVVETSLRQRWWVIAGSVALFVLSIVGFRFVEQQFFPSSTRPELLVDLKLAEGASLRATQAQVRKLEAELADDEDLVNYVAFVGSGAPRFYLPLDQQLPQASFAQFVLLARDTAARERIRARLLARFDEDYTELRSRVLRLENGPPTGYPVQFRVAGEDLGQVRAIANEVAQIVRGHDSTRNTHLDWEEPSKVVRVQIDQDRARVLGVSSLEVATFLRSALTGTPVSVYREGNELIDVVLRGDENARARLSSLDSLIVPTASGQAVPLAQIARIEHALEDGIIWRRDRLPTVTVRADLIDGIQPATAMAQLEPHLARIRADLAPGYRIEIGGPVEASVKGQDSVNAGMPLFLFVVMTVLMLQLKSFPRVLLVMLTAPLGLIGVVAFLLLFRVPFGFVAMLGTIALFGMIMRNAVILIDQIEQDISAGHPRWQAVVDATVRRFRPIVLTAMTAVLAMIPLSRSDFYGPMAFAIMGGLIVGTALTLVLLPALYAAWFRVRETEREPTTISP